MAESQKNTIKQETPAKLEAREERLVRILSQDIEGKMKVYPGLTRIKGVSWAISNAVCKKLKIGKDRRIGSLSDKELEEVEEFLRNPEIPFFLKNRRKDYFSGEDKHLITSNLELQKEFDIKRMKKIKNYKGIRHAAGLPVRGQKTRSHFRSQKSKKSKGIKQKPQIEKQATGREK